jgi:hypothetical protein
VSLAYGPLPLSARSVYCKNLAPSILTFPCYPSPKLPTPVLSWPPWPPAAATPGRRRQREKSGLRAERRRPGGRANITIVERRGGVEGAGRGTGAGRSSVDRAFWRGRGRGRLTIFSLLSSRLDEHGDGEGKPDPGITGDLEDLDEEAGHREKKGVELWRRRPRQQSPRCSREWTWPGPALGRRPLPVRCHRVWTGARESGLFS